MNKLFVSLAAFGLCLSAAARGLLYHEDPATGAITRLSLDGDTTAMNWVLQPDGTQYAWVTSQYGWGLGYLTVDGRQMAWTHPMRNAKGHLSYHAGSVTITVSRRLVRGELRERYELRNTGRRPAHITNCGIYTPWNDNYPAAATCIAQRCNAHIWPGDEAAYVCALRMGCDGRGETTGRGNVGLAATRGALTDYEVWLRGNDKGASNFRGVLAMCLPDTTLAPGRSYAVEWALFEHGGKDDFDRKLRAHGSAVVTSPKYVYQQGETVRLSVNGKPRATFVAASPGPQRVELDYGRGRRTHANILVVSNYDSLIARRVRFILDHQQLRDTTDARNGAFMVYDNEAHGIYLNNDWRRSADTDEGRERVGMGVLLAEYYKLHPSARIKTALERYATFIKTQLQAADYTTYSEAGRRGYHRGYNYTWVADFYFLMYEVTGRRQYALDGYHTLRILFRHFCHAFYCIDYPVTTGLRVLGEAGLTAQRDTLRDDLGRVARVFMDNGLNFPKFEVNFEQSIVSPAVQFLLEYYLETRDEQYLRAADKMQPVSENFCGRQPDFRLHEIAIRHWDGYWFGRRCMYGDTFPHYWSAINAMVYHYYALATGRGDYHERAQEVVRNNLSNVFEDGSATCAFVYPRRVDGKPAHFADPLANDQDWALVFYLRTATR